MCSSDAFSNIGDFSKFKLKEDFTPSLNPQKHLKTKLKNDWDFNNAQTAQKQQRVEVAKQAASIDQVNKNTSLMADDILARRKASTLLTDDSTKTILG